MKTFLFLCLLLFKFISYSQNICEQSFNPFIRINGNAPMERLSDTKIGSYNVLNLEHSAGKYVTDEKTGTRSFVPQKLTKDKDQVNGVVRVFKDEQPDIVVLQEVEGYEAIKLFNDKYLDGLYTPIVLKGNDTRGIEIAFLVKSDLPLKVKTTSLKNSKWKNSVSGNLEYVFSRDLPALHFWHKDATGSDPPAFILLGNHLKSQRDRKGDPKSIIKRTAQVNEITNEIKRYQSAYPQTPVILAGDFNANILSGSEFKQLFDNNLMTDSLNFSSKSYTKEQRITHTFHPYEGPSKNSQLDAILVNEQGKDLVIDSHIYRYRDENGSVIPIPKTYDQRERNPSDHFPLFTRFDFSRLFK